MKLLALCFSKLFGSSLGLPPQYVFIKKLGKGAEGEVWLCADDATNQLVAVKLIPRGPPAWRLDSVAREGRMLALLGGGHINITRPLELVLTSKHLALVTEYVPGGSLADWLAHHRPDEDTARYFFRQLLSALSFCHGRKVVYRDIKPANCLLTSTTPPILKLCDFGLADSWEGKETPTFDTLAGTPGYMDPAIMANFFTPSPRSSNRSATTASASSGGTAAPGSRSGGHAADAAVEVVAYDGVEADVYSLGVLLVVMLCKSMPWHYDTYAARLPPLEAMRRLYQLEVLDNVSWRDATHQADKLSPQLAALLDRMLEPDPVQRATLHEVAASEWVSTPLPPKLQVALDVLGEQQQLREALCGCGSGLSSEEVASRLAQLESMMTAAQTVGKGVGFRLEARLQLAPPRRGSVQLQRPQPAPPVGAAAPAAAAAIAAA